jgi:ParB family chromosome partitioning protein
MTAPGSRHSGLGRGLASLIPARTATMAAPTEIPLGRIRANPYQPRHHMQAEALRDLAASIAEHGVIQPILVTETIDGYQLIAGERRLRAAEMAGLDRIPALVRQLAGEEQLELALVENIQRADLNPLEEAGAYRQLIAEFGLSQEEVAKKVGRARSSVANTLRLLDLAPAVQEAIRGDAITEGHGRALASLDAPAQQEALLAAVVGRGLSVRQTEELARRLKVRATTSETAGRAARSAPDPDPELERIESDLRTALGTRVTITRSRTGGRIVIDFYGDEELARILERLAAGPS